MKKSWQVNFSNYPYPVNTMSQKIIKVGTHSLAVIIPAEFVHSLGLRSGDYVKVVIDKEKGKVTLIFSGVLQLSLASQNNIKFIKLKE
jgi:hypothetical protein